MKKTLGVASPVMLLHGDNLLFLYKGTNKVVRYVPEIYHLIKDIAHIACTLHTLHWLKDQNTQDKKTLLRQNFDAIISQELPSRLEKYKPLLKQYRQLVQTNVQESELLSLKPALESLVKDAAEVRTNALHEQVQAIQRQVCPLQWSRLSIIVMGPRMPREGELGMQYSKAMILKSPDLEQCPHLNGALTKSVHVIDGKRLIYAESIEEVDKALDLLTTEICDEDLGEALLGDKKVMRADFLKDAVREHLLTLKNQV